VPGKVKIKQGAYCISSANSSSNNGIGGCFGGQPLISIPAS
jgi:hypothetical protein